MPLVGAPADCLHASVSSVGPTFSSVAFFLVFPRLLSSVCVCVCVCMCVCVCVCLLRALAPVDKQTRSVVLRRAKQSLSVVIQTRLADLLLGAERSRGAAAPVAA